MKKGINIILVFILLFFLQGFSMNKREPFDKTPYLKTCWTQANPWFPPNLSRSIKSCPGGPDFCWWKLPENSILMWKEVAVKCKSYGLTGIQMEIHIGRQFPKCVGWLNVFVDMLEGFEQAKNGFMAIPFLGILTKEEFFEPDIINAFDTLIPILKSHPNVYKINGMPVVSLYNLNASVEKWTKAIDDIEKKHGRIIWLVNAAHVDEKWIRNVLPYFDGITMYANWSEEYQKNLYSKITPVMHNEFPDKIFEGGVHTTYCVHFHYGGVSPKLTEKYRNSWEITLSSKPDSISITNFFDIYENSRIFPSYECEDILMKIAQYHLQKWRKEEIFSTNFPDLYIANYTNVLLGKNLVFEVIGFPLKDKENEVTVTLEICDSKENILYTFEPRKMTLDQMRVEVYEIESDKFYNQLAIHPRIKYTWKNNSYVSYLFPQTNLVTSIRPHLLFWCRSLKRMIQIDTSRSWEIDGKKEGDIVFYPENGRIFIKSFALSQGMEGVENRGGGWVRILRNGREIESFGRWDLKFSKIVNISPVMDSLNWFNLELENGYGCRYLSPPIWMVNNKRMKTIKLPVLTSNGEIKKIEIQDFRVPYFYYKCDRDTGRFLMDYSGYDHYGFLGGTGYGGGHLGFTGYNHEHYSPTGISPDEIPSPKFKIDTDGKGYLEFDGKSYVMIQGGTAFPYASTYEFYLKPYKRERQGIMGAPNGQITIFLTEDGYIEVQKTAAVEGMGGATPKKSEIVRIVSKEKLQVNEWTHIAVVYNLEELSLYINGKLQDKKKCIPNPDHEWINVIVIGGTCAFPFNPQPSFVGGIREIRFYGRNLEPEEFLLKK